MGSLGELSAKLKLDGAPAMMAGLKSVGGAASQLTSLLSAVQGPLALLGVGFGAFKSAQGFTDALKGVFETGRELSILSRETGESVGSLKMLQGAFKQATGDAGELPMILREVQQHVGEAASGSKTAAEGFQRLGLSAASLKNMSGAQQIQALAGALAKVPDQATRMALATDVAARSGQSLIAIANDPNALAGLGKGMSAQAEIFQRQAKTFSAITSDLAMLGSKLNTFFVGFADRVGPVILPLLDKIKSIDFTAWGEQVGRFVAILAQAFKQGSISELIGDALQLGGMKFVNFMSGAIVGIGRGLGAAAALYVDVMGEYFSHFPTYIAALKDGLVGAVEFMGATLLEVMGKPIEAFQNGLEYAVQGMMYQLGKIPKVGKWLGLDSTAAPDYEKIAADRKANGGGSLFGFGVGDLAAKAQDSFDKAAEGMKTTFGAVNFSGGLKEILAQFQSGMKEGGVFDASQMGQLQDKLTGLIGQLDKAASAASSSDGSSTQKAGVASSSAGEAKQIDTDRLARIGLFVGGAGGPALDYHKRTAAATETTAKAVQALLVHSQALSPGVVVWG